MESHIFFQIDVVAKSFFHWLDQGAVCVSIKIPENSHTVHPVSNGGAFYWQKEHSVNPCPHGWGQSLDWGMRPHHAFGDGVFRRPEKMKIFNWAVVGALAGTRMCASTMVAMNVLIHLRQQRGVLQSVTLKPCLMTFRSSFCCCQSLSMHYEQISLKRSSNNWLNAYETLPSKLSKN